MSVLRTMFHTKTLASRADHDFLPIAPAQPTREPKQRRMMAIALALLIVALGFVLYMDRDFWFPDTQEADDQLEPVPAITAATQPATRPAVELPTGISRPPIVAKKNHASKSQAKVVAPAVSSKPVAAAATTTAAAVAPNVAVPASAPPLNATTTRTVLPPLEVEVVAGDNHRTVRPGTNSVHVDLQPGSAPRPVANPPATKPVTASAVTTNAAERVQMSAGAAEVVSQPVKPGYPMLARQMRVQGSVILQALIGRDGTIQDLHVLSGPAILADAAQDAVRQWRFKPHYVGNDAVETQAKITVNFTISTN